MVKGEKPNLSQVVHHWPDGWNEAQERIRAYGARLIGLPEQAWDTSIYIWYGSFWEVLVDLYAEDEGRTDLVLKVQVSEANDSYRYEVALVYVP